MTRGKRHSIIRTAGRAGQHTAINHNGLPGHEGPGGGTQKHRSTGDFIRLPNALERRVLGALGVNARIFPQRAGEIGADQARRNGIGADVFRPPFHREVPHQLHIGRLGNGIGAQHRGAAKAADGGDDDDGTPAAFRHAWRGHVRKPEVGFDVGRHDLIKNLIRHGHGRAEMRVDRRIADHDIHLAPGGDGLVYQRLTFILAPDIAGNGHGLAALGLDGFHHLLAGIQLAGGYHHLGAVFGHSFTNRPANAAAATGDNGHLAGQIE